MLALRASSGQAIVRHVQQGSARERKGRHRTSHRNTSLPWTMNSLGLWPHNFAEQSANSKIHINLEFDQSELGVKSMNLNSTHSIRSAEMDMYNSHSNRPAHFCNVPWTICLRQRRNLRRNDETSKVNTSSNAAVIQSMVVAGKITNGVLPPLMKQTFQCQEQSVMPE